MPETVVSTGDMLSTGARDVAILTAAGILAVAAEPSGAGAVVMMVAAPIAFMNIRAPGPFAEASEKWGDLATTLGTLAYDIGELNGAVDLQWEGNGAEAFKTFLETRMLKQFESLKTMCKDAANACETVAGALDTFFFAWLVGTALTTVVCFSTNMAWPASAAAKWVIIGIWVGFVVAIVLAIQALMISLGGATGQFESAVKSLGETFKMDGDKVKGDSVKIDSYYRQLVIDASRWTKEVKP